MADEEPDDWSVSTTTNPRGVVKSVDAMASGVHGSGRDFDIIFLRLLCKEGMVSLEMSRPFGSKQRIFDATFFDRAAKLGLNGMRTYWRSDDGQQDGVYDGNSEALLARIGDGGFDLEVEGNLGRRKRFAFNVQDTKLTYSRVKASCFK